jgi:hypothetical protein
MRSIGIQPWMPKHRNRYLGRSDRKAKTMHSDAQVPGVSFGNSGDQVGGPSESQRDRKAAHNSDDLRL